ncbi:MAG: hypothetical protein GQ534_04315 [Candidatus Delongbacteria bacterium]|nr:hypothetical protein [Candidatus Delongbacteria bacterium]
MQTSSIIPWIAGYAAIISTIALFWNILVFILQNKQKIKVSAYFTGSFEQSMGTGITSDTSWNLSVEIVNLSKTKKFIKRPALLFPKNTTGTRNFQWLSPNDKTNYPKALEPAESCSVHMKIGGDKDLLDIINKTKTINKKLQIVVKDNLNKEYKSNKISIKDIADYCDL